MVKEFVSTITGKGQVTIPSEIRQRLGVAPTDKVMFVVSDTGAVELQPVRHSISSLRGIVPALPGRETVDFEDIIKEAFDEKADAIVRELEGK